MFLLPPHHRHHIEVTNSLLYIYVDIHSTTDVAPTRCLVNELAERPRPSFEAKRRHCQVSLTHGNSTPRPLGRQSRALTTELERETCGKLRCRGLFSSFLTNPFICFECYSNVERINEGIISNAKHEQQKPNSGNPSLAQPMSGLVTATCLDWPTGMPTFARVVRHPVKIHGNYRSCIYAATVIQREREALTNMAAG